VKFVLKGFPLSSECNSIVPTNMHDAACTAAAGAVMARGKGTAPALVDWFFLHQDDLTPETTRKAIIDIGKITDYDTEYPRAIQEVKTDVAIGQSQGINSTPTFYINGRKIPGGGLPPNYFEAAIELELQRAK
jgi:protein-disulfide isomerase